MIMSTTGVFRREDRGLRLRHHDDDYDAAATNMPDAVECGMLCYDVLTITQHIV